MCTGTGHVPGRGENSAADGGSDNHGGKLGKTEFFFLRHRCGAGEWCIGITHVVNLLAKYVCSMSPLRPDYTGGTADGIGIDLFR